MTVAFVAGMVGSLISLVLGTQFLHLDVIDLVLSIFSSNLAALIALMITVQTPRFPSPLKEWTAGTFRAWILAVSVYLSILEVLSPLLRDWRSIFYLCFPLILSTGFGILVFGFIRDRMVRNQQRNAVLQSHKAVGDQKALQR